METIYDSIYNRYGIFELEDSIRRLEYLIGRLTEESEEITKIKSQAEKTVAFLQGMLSSSE